MKKIEDIDYEIRWEGQPTGLWQRVLTMTHMNFTYYQITKDELIIKKGFFKQRTNTIELYLLKDPDMTKTLYQRLLGIGTISVVIDTHSNSDKAGTKMLLQNIKDCEKVRKLTYFDKV